MYKALLRRLPPSLATAVRFVVHVNTAVARDNLTHVAAGIAFYGLLALFPGISAAISLLGLLIKPEIVMAEIDRLSQVMPEQAAQIVLNQVAGVAGTGSTQLSFGFAFGLALTFYSASKGMQSLMDGLNMAHNERETRGFFRRMLIRQALTLCLILGLFIGVSLTVVLPAVLAFLHLDGLPGGINDLRWPVLAVLTLGGLRLLYWAAPNHSRRVGGWLTWGTVVATVLWVAGSLGFSWYVSNFAYYNKTFGALGGVIVLLMWLWLSGMVILIGAEIDAAVELFRKPKEARRDPVPGL